MAHYCIHLCRQVDRLPVTLLHQVDNGCIQVLILPLLLPGGCLCNGREFTILILFINWDFSEFGPLWPVLDVSY
uniref:Uncharacterized protein n=1 Tax=Magallana gigas TaxID=29159 RepID=K1QQP0_MAGGI